MAAWDRDLGCTAGVSAKAGVLDGWFTIWCVTFRSISPEENANAPCPAAFSPSTNPDVLWCLNRTHAAFQQIDIAKEADEPLRIVPTATVAWSPEGSLAFAVRNSDAPSIIGRSAAA